MTPILNRVCPRFQVLQHRADYFPRARFFCFATFAPCLPSAVRVARGSFEIVFFARAAFAAFLMFLRAAAFCFAVAMVSLLHVVEVSCR